MRRSLGYGVVSNHRGNRNGGGGIPQIRREMSLASSRCHGLCFDGNEIVKNVLVGYSGTDYADDPDTRRSTSGYVFILNDGAVTLSNCK